MTGGRGRSWPAIDRFPNRESLSKKLGEKDDNSETDNEHLFWQEMSVSRVET